MRSSRPGVTAGALATAVAVIAIVASAITVIAYEGHSTPAQTANSSSMPSTPSSPSTVTTASSSSTPSSIFSSASSTVLASSSTQEAETYSTASTSSGLELELDLNSTTLDYGSTIRAQITLFNSLDDNLSLGASFPANSSIQSWNGYDFFCGENNFLPMLGYALFQGYYSQSNITTAGIPLQLAPSVNIGCVTYPKPTSIVFLPDSDAAVLFSPAWSTGYQESASTTASTESCIASSTGAWLCGGSAGLTGYWDTTSPITEQNATIGSESFSYFSPGVYTLAVEDIWNQTIYAHFLVTPAATTSTTTSFECSITGQPGGIFVRVLSDSNQTPVAGASIKATNAPAYCDSTPATRQTTVNFTTSSDTEWYPLNSENSAGYSFVVVYLGQTYTFAASLRPLSLTCVTLYVPSGVTNVTTTVFQTTC